MARDRAETSAADASVAAVIDAEFTAGLFRAIRLEETPELGTCQEHIGHAAADAEVAILEDRVARWQNHALL